MHDLHRFVDDLFAQLQERLTSGTSGPSAFKVLLSDLIDYFDRAPRGAALEILQTFCVRTQTPFSSYLQAFCMVVADMSIELFRIRTAQHYPMLMLTHILAKLATREFIQHYARYCWSRLLHFARLELTCSFSHSRFGYPCFRFTTPSPRAICLICTFSPRPIFGRLRPLALR